MNKMALRVWGIDGVPGSELSLGGVNASSVIVGSRHANINLNGRTFINGQRALTDGDLGPAVMAQADAAAFGGVAGGAFVLFALLLARATMSLVKARAMRRWLARQPKPVGDPYRSPMFEGAHRVSSFPDRGRSVLG